MTTSNAVTTTATTGSMNRKQRRQKQKQAAKASALMPPTTHVSEDGTPYTAQTEREVGAEALRQGRTKVAQVHLMRSLEMEPDHKEATYSLLLSLLADTRTRDTMSRVTALSQTSIEKHPKNLSFYLTKCVSHVHKLEFAETRKCFREAVLLDPGLDLDSLADVAPLPLSPFSVDAGAADVTHADAADTTSAVNHTARFNYGSTSLAELQKYVLTLPPNVAAMSLHVTLAELYRAVLPGSEVVRGILGHNCAQCEHLIDLSIGNNFRVHPQYRLLLIRQIIHNVVADAVWRAKDDDADADKTPKPEPVLKNPFQETPSNGVKFMSNADIGFASLQSMFSVLDQHSGVDGQPANALNTVVVVNDTFMTDCGVAMLDYFASIKLTQPSSTSSSSAAADTNADLGRVPSNHICSFRHFSDEQLAQVKDMTSHVTCCPNSPAARAAKAAAQTGSDKLDGATVDTKDGDDGFVVVDKKEGTAQEDKNKQLAESKAEAAARRSSAPQQILQELQCTKLTCKLMDLSTQLDALVLTMPSDAEDKFMAQYQERAVEMLGAERMAEFDDQSFTDVYPVIEDYSKLMSAISGIHQALFVVELLGTCAEYPDLTPIGFETLLMDIASFGKRSETDQIARHMKKQKLFLATVAKQQADEEVGLSEDAVKELRATRAKQEADREKMKQKNQEALAASSAESRKKSQHNQFLAMGDELTDEAVKKHLSKLESDIVKNSLSNRVNVKRVTGERYGEIEELLLAAEKEGLFMFHWLRDFVKLLLSRRHIQRDFEAYDKSQKESLVLLKKELNITAADPVPVAKSPEDNEQASSLDNLYSLSSMVLLKVVSRCLLGKLAASKTQKNVYPGVSVPLLEHKSKKKKKQKQKKKKVSAGAAGAVQ